MKSKIFAGNWKLHKNPEEARQFIAQLKHLLPEKLHSQVVLFPSAPTWFCFAENKTFQWGAQNIFFENTGAFTGENSPEVLAQMGGGYCLIGHSERRSLFAEPEMWMSQKVKKAQGMGLTPVLCVGESLEQREKGQVEEVLVRQFNEGLKEVSLKLPLWIAYEPVWAIGTGKVATPIEANEAHQILRKLLIEKGGATWAGQVPLLYGGSVKPDNAKDLAEQPEIDGFLVGGASLKPEDFAQICLIS